MTIKKRIVVLAVAAALAPNLALAGDKSDICHVTGNSGFQLINVSNRALMAHLGHGDSLPGELSEGTPYAGGCCGIIVTPVSLVGTDCSTTDVLKAVLPTNFQQNQGEGNPAGWGGVSCVDFVLDPNLGFTKVVGGGVVSEDATVIAQGPAKFGAAAVDGNNYPVYPHYTFNGGFNTAGGEEGWVVGAAGNSPPTAIYALCGE